MLASRIPGALLILMLALAACSRDGEAEADAAQQVAATPVEAFFRYGMVAIGSSRAALRASFGEPDSTTFRAVANTHDAAVTDTVFTVHYPGLAVEVYRASFDGRELLASVHITADRYLRPESPLRLGASREEIRLALGEPDRDEDGDLFYTCTSCNLDGQDALELLLEAGTLRQIIVQYWLD